MEIETARPPAWRAVDLPAIQDCRGQCGNTIARSLTAHQIQGRRSDLTFFLSNAAGSCWVLRPHPMGHFLATAHDLPREFRFLRALAGAIAVPAVIGLHQNADGVPFCVMHAVPERVIRPAAYAEVLTPVGAGRGGLELMARLATLHGLDPDSVGLPDPHAGTCTDRAGIPRRMV